MRDDDGIVRWLVAAVVTQAGILTLILHKTQSALSSLEIAVVWIASVSFLYAEVRRRAGVVEVEQRLSAWSSATQDLMAVADVTIPYSLRRFKWVNQAWTAQTGWSVAEILSMPIRNLLCADAPDGGEVAGCSVFRGATGPAESAAKVCRVRCKDGSYRVYDWSSVYRHPLVYASGRDVTEIQRLIVSLRDTNDRLQNANTALSRFTAVASHQLQQAPRTICKLVSEIKDGVAEDASAEETLHLLGRVQVKAEYMVEVVKALKDLSALRSGVLTFERVSLKAVIEDMLRHHELLSKAQGSFTISVKPSQYLLDPMWVSRVIAVEAVANVVINGLKFNRSEHPVISIWAQPTYFGASLFIRDNGIGLSDDYKAKMFEPFQRGTKDFPGTGIGLSFVREAMERMSGAVSLVETAPNAGTTFRLDFTVSDRLPARLT